MIQYSSTQRFIKGKLFSSIERLLPLPTPVINIQHEGFTFIKKAAAQNFRKGSHIGVYRDLANKKYVIKDYSYRFKDLNFEYLQNEINTLVNLGKWPNNVLKVQIVPIVQYEIRDRRITIVTKFIEAKNIQKLNYIEIENILCRILKYLSSVSKEISRDSLETIPVRKHYMNYTTISINLCRALFKEPNQIHLFLKTWLLYLRYAWLYIFKKATYSIAHTDLSTDNILYDNNADQITLLDTEGMVRADNLYDMSSLPRIYAKYLSPSSILNIINTLNLNHSDKKRLIILMINNCVSEIATEIKGTQNYMNALKGLKNTVEIIAPRLITL